MITVSHGDRDHDVSMSQQVYFLFVFNYHQISRTKISHLGGAGREVGGGGGCRHRGIQRLKTSQG